ncbi:MAG TPA: MBL fold metallo-hydrolase RNA specificity domain-containing protein [Candidatus Nanoarchaeia archaeon]|nr:MBL fold metallo-hydrolase RNA specificity domain-containing protein [Candidatus Nanoarchaeia archaeon]
MISFDGLFELPARMLGIETGGKEVTLVSHAHSDHLPTRYKKNHIVCSEITGKVIEHKKRKEIKRFSHSSIELYDAGHVLGSSMFLINKRVLYTGDFNFTEGGGVNLIPCETLIMECTYGKPQYVFPSREKVFEELREYIVEHGKVMISCSDSFFGKVQELCFVLDGFGIPFSVHAGIRRMNEHLGLFFKHCVSDADVLITTPLASVALPGWKQVKLTGWASEGWNVGGDASFVLSSHADYPSLLAFVEGCKPKTVYLHHGFVQEFAADLRGRGYRAFPLVALTGEKREKGQLTIGKFW